MAAHLLPPQESFWQFFATFFNKNWRHFDNVVNVASILTKTERNCCKVAIPQQLLWKEMRKLYEISKDSSTHLSFETFKLSVICLQKTAPRYV